MLNRIITNIFGSRNQRLVKQYQKTVTAINALEPQIELLARDQLAKAGRFPINLARDGRRYFASRTELLQELDHPGSVRPELCDDKEGAA